MNVYHKILIRLYRETDGKTSEKIDFVNLVKNEGFYSSYADILNQLNTQGWIIEAGRDNVSITPWGVKEAKKLAAGDGGEKAAGSHGSSKKDLEKAVNRLKSEARELLITTEEFLSTADENSLKAVETKLRDVTAAFKNLKENFQG